MAFDLFLSAVIWTAAAASSLLLPQLSQPHRERGIRIAGDVLIRGSPGAWIILISRQAAWTPQTFSWVLGLWLVCYAGTIAIMRRTPTDPQNAAMRSILLITANVLAAAAIAIPIMLTPS